MAHLIQPLRWRRQPQYAVDVDWSNPITRGLRMAFSFGDPRCGNVDTPTNLATGFPVTKVGSTLATVSAGPHGRWAAQVTPTGNYWVPDVTTSGAVSVVAFRRYGDVVSARGVLVANSSTDWLGWDSADAPQITDATSARVTGAVARPEQVVGWDMRSTAYRIYQDGIETDFSSGSGSPFAINKILGIASGSTFRNRIYCLYVWNRPLTAAEHHELALAPYSLFKPIQRRVYLLGTQPILVDLNVAGGLTVAGQTGAAVRLGVAPQAGGITIAGQAIAVRTGVNLSGAGSVTIGGEDSALVVSNDLHASIDVAGSVTISGEDSAVMLFGDIEVDLDEAGSISIEGQDCAISLTIPQQGGQVDSRPRKRRQIRPQDLPPMEVDINFLQPWQTCAATVEVEDSVFLQMEQEGSLLNSTAEAVADVSVEVQQQVSDLLAKFAAVPLRSAPVRIMAKSETARVRVMLEQPAHEFAATVDVA